MNIEEKAKAYDEALKWMRELYPTLQGATKEDAEHFFPELCESEDERIRKELIAQVEFIIPYENECDDDGNVLPAYRERIERYRTYLENQKDAFENGRQLGIMQEQARQELEWPDEKQKEPVPTEEEMISLLKMEYEKGVADTIAKYEQKEKKPVVTHGETYHVDTLGTQQVIAGKMPQKPAWSEEDENTIADLINYFEGDSLECSTEEMIQRIKSLRPQSKDEIYKEKDEAFKLDKHQLAIKFMNYLDENRPEGKMSLSNAECEDIDKAFKENDWNKIIRYVEKYQPHWKPSEEQIGALEVIVKYGDKESTHIKSLRELYEQLKKLM